MKETLGYQLLSLMRSLWPPSSSKFLFSQILLAHLICYLQRFWQSIFRVFSLEQVQHGQSQIGDSTASTAYNPSLLSSSVHHLFFLFIKLPFLPHFDLQFWELYCMYNSSVPCYSSLPTTPLLSLPVCSSLFHSPLSLFLPFVLYLVLPCPPLAFLSPSCFIFLHPVPSLIFFPFCSPLFLSLYY